MLGGGRGALQQLDYSIIIDHFLVDLFNFDAVDADGYSAFGGIKGRSQPKQDPPIERDLALTLEEVYNGGIKKMKISRKVGMHTYTSNTESFCWGVGSIVFVLLLQVCVVCSSKTHHLVSPYHGTSDRGLSK